MAQKSKFGISQVQLTQMMDVADKRGMKRVDELGGIEGIATHVKSNLKKGLHPDEVKSEQRLSEFGVNFVKPRPPKSFLALIFEAAQDKVLIVLLVCAFISIILSVSVVTPEERKTGWVEGFAIFLAVFIVVMVTAINDYTKERQFRELQKKLDSTSRYTLIRDGERLEVGTDEIVVGDVLEFKYGNAFPCDGLFIRGNDVSVSEASLTGESNNIKKNSTMNPFLYSGTQVMEGTGTMLVVAVGPYSQHGIILALLTSADDDDDDGFITAALKSIWKRIRPQERKPLASSRSSDSEEDEKGMEANKANGDIEEEEEDLEQFRMNCCQRMLHPQKWMRNKKELKKRRKKIKTEAKGSVLQRKLTRLALQIGYFGIAAAVLIVVVAIFRHCIEEYAIEGRGWERNDIIRFLRFFINGLTVLVVAVPEGLPLAVTIALAYSIKKMLNDNNLVRHLHSCETMGNATCICSDKTGTLTTNRMTVVDSYIAQTRSVDEIPDSKTFPMIVKETLEQTIAVNSSYSSTLKRPDNCLNAEGRSLWNKITGVFRRRPVQPPQDNGEGGQVKSKGGSDEPLTLEELKSLVRGEEGLLVEQIGNPTECALLGLLVELDIDYDSARLQHPREAYVKQFTFNAARKSMTTVVSLPDNKGSRVLTKGASELVLSKCTSVLSSTGEVVPLTEAMRSEILDTVVCSMASKALRTIGMAYKDVSESSVSLEDSGITVLKPAMDWENENEVVSDLTLIGIVGIEDPVRPEVFESIKKCQRAGITVRMVTGDNIDTARSIAEKCGIIPKGDKTLYVLEGPKFRQKVLDENGEPVQEKLDKIWPRLRVLARSSPKDKYTLVEGIINSRITKTREVVAVTGDGTNDGPALKRADVGFAMGIAGTDVAKEACDIILTDDNFASIVKAVKWGRNIYDAISKFLQFQLTVNVVAVSIAVIGSFSIGDTPLRAIQLLWVNLVMDTFASLALATEPPTDELLKRAPYGRKKKLISRRMFLFIAGHSTYQLTTLLVLLYAGPQLFDIDKGSLEDVFAEPTQHFTLIFNTFVFMQIFNEFNARRIHGEQNVFGGMHRNIIFLCIMAVQVILQVLWVEIPVLNREVFKATNLSIDLWLWCIFLGSVELIIGQILSLIPIEKIPEFKWPWEHEDDDPADYWEDEDDNKAKVLWVKSLNRLRTQIRVVNAFKAGLDSGDNLHLSRLPHLAATPKSKRYYHEGPNDLDCRISDV